MSDIRPQMKVCPYCKKPFKRLKSHLPHCKMMRPATPTNQNISQLKPPTDPHTKKVSRELAKDMPISKESGCHPSETEALLLAGSVEPALLNQDRNYSSPDPNDIQASPANLKLDTVDPQRQGLLVKLLDMPTDIYHQSSANLTDRAKNITGAVLSKERDSRGRGHLSGVFTGIEDTEIQKKNSESLVLGLHIGPLAKIQVEENEEKGLGLGMERCRSKGNAEKTIFATEMQKWDSVNHDSKNCSSGDRATEKPKNEGRLIKVLTPQMAVYSQFLPMSPSDSQSLAPLAVESLQEGKAQFCSHNQVPDRKLLGKSKAAASLEPKSGCQPQVLHSWCQQSIYSGQHCFSKSAFIDHVGAVDRKTLPSSIGLEWFPELYSGYLGLGVLARRPQYWNSMVQKPPLSSPQWGNLSQGWVRCSTTLKKSGVGSITMLFARYFTLCCSWSFRHLRRQLELLSKSSSSVPRN